MEEDNRIHAKEIIVSNDMRKTRLNNNDVIIGASGSGKSSGYVIPNIRQHSESLIIADTKGCLYKQMHKELEAEGYVVKVLDFVNPRKSCPYNPLDYIGMDEKNGKWKEQDIVSLAEVILPTRYKKDPFWEESARMVLTSLIAFVKEALPAKEQNMESVAKLAKILNDAELAQTLFSQLEGEKPDSFAVRKFRLYREVMLTAKKTWYCILQSLNVVLSIYDFADIGSIYGKSTTFRLEELGQSKAALFVNVSDTDRSLDRLVNTFYTQVIQTLCKEADRNTDGRLQMPVRIILDDFANNVVIPDFDKMISVIRSRELSVSIILQSISQLETLYTQPQAVTIVNDCDHMVYLGGQDIKTPEYISIKANRPIEDILNMGLNDAYLFERGSEPRKVEKMNIFNREQVLKERKDVGEVNESMSFDI